MCGECHDIVLSPTVLVLYIVPIVTNVSEVDGPPFKIILAARLSRGEEQVWSNSHHRLVPNTPTISWYVNWLSDEWRRTVAFFLACGILMEILPFQNTSQFMFTATSLDALLLSMQHKSLM